MCVCVCVCVRVYACVCAEYHASPIAPPVISHHLQYIPSTCQPCLVPLPGSLLCTPRFLDIVQSLSSYGSHMFKVKDKKEGVRHIAVGREGVKIFRPEDRLTPSEVQ